MTASGGFTQQKPIALVFPFTLRFDHFISPEGLGAH